MKVRVTKDFIKNKIERSHKGGWPVPKWVTFCQTLMMEGFIVEVHESLSTRSKYVYVSKKHHPKPYLVRFSNHKPNYGTEKSGACDFFVGVTNFAVTNTDQALDAVRKFFGNKEGIKHVKDD